MCPLVLDLYPTIFSSFYTETVASDQKNIWYNNKAVVSVISLIEPY